MARSRPWQIKQRSSSEADSAKNASSVTDLEQAHGQVDS